MASEASSNERHLVFVVEGTAALAPHWPTLRTNYIQELLSDFCRKYDDDQGVSQTPNVQMALIVFYTHGRDSAGGARRSPWTRNLELFIGWLSGIDFCGGGYGGDSNIVGGLGEALAICPYGQTTHTTQMHCVLVATSKPFLLPMVITRPACLTQLNENEEPVIQPWKVDPEIIAKAFGECGVSLSIISPRNLQVFLSLYDWANAEENNAKYSENSAHLVLISKKFKDACSIRRSSGTTSSSISLTSASVQLPAATSSVSVQPPAETPSVSVQQTPAISESATTQSVSVQQPIALQSVSVQSLDANVIPSSYQTGNEIMVEHQPMSNAATPAESMDTEGITMSMESAPLFSSMTPASLSSTTHAFAFTFSTPSRQSSGDKKGNVSSSSGQSTRGEKEDVSSASGKSTRGKRAGTLGHQTPGSARSSGFRTPAVPTARTVLASRQSGLTSSPTSVISVGAGQITPNLAQNTFGGGLLGSSVNTGFTGKNVVGGLGQQAPVVGREGVTAGSQIGQCQIGRSQDVLADIRVVGPSSLGLPVLGADDSAGGNIQLPSTTTVAEQPGATAADMDKVWEGLLRIRDRHIADSHISICRLQAFCREASSENIAADWPLAMDIEKLVPEDKVESEVYEGKAVFLSFRALNYHEALKRLAERKVWAMINLPTQILLLSNFDRPGQLKPGHLMGMVSPRDASLPIQPHLQQQQQPSQLHLRQQQQQPSQLHLQHQQQQPSQLHVQHQQQQQSQLHLLQQQQPNQMHLQPLQQQRSQMHLQQQQSQMQQQQQSQMYLQQQQQQQNQMHLQQQQQQLSQMHMQQLLQQHQQSNQLHLHKQQQQQSQMHQQKHQTSQLRQQWQQPSQTLQQHQQPIQPNLRKQQLHQQQWQQPSQVQQQSQTHLQEQLQQQEEQQQPSQLQPQQWQQQQQPWQQGQQEQKQPPQTLVSTLAQVHLTDQTKAQVMPRPQKQKQRQRQDRQSKGVAPAVEIESVQCQFPSQSRAQQPQKPQRLLSDVGQAPAQSQLLAQSRPQVMASGHQQLQRQKKNPQPQEMSLATGQAFLPSQFSTQLQDEQQNSQSQLMPLATGHAFPPSQFSNEGDYQLRKPQPKGMPFEIGQSFSPSQFSNQGQHWQQNPQPQKLTSATGQPFLPSQFSNQTITPISLDQQQQQRQEMPSGFRSAFPQSQFRNQMFIGQPQGMPSTMGQAFPRHSQGQDPGSVQGAGNQS